MKSSFRVKVTLSAVLPLQPKEKLVNLTAFGKHHVSFAYQDEQFQRHHAQPTVPACLLNSHELDL